MEATEKYNVPVAYYNRLKQGEDYIVDGNLIANNELTIPNKPPRSYAYCADTLYNESLVEKIKDVNTLYHETTYLKDKQEKASRRFHSTTLQAAQLQTCPRKNFAHRHFSSILRKTGRFFNRSSGSFPDTKLALEGQTYLITYS